MNNKKPLSLYIHIPYCIKKCAYCDFVSYTDKASTADEYCNAVIRELSSYKLDEYTVRTVFFGGGTPSSIKAELIGKIMSAIQNTCDVAQDAEITIECNPCTLDAAKLAEYKKMGINRLSIGVQSFDDGLLGLIGRAHDAATARKSILCANDAGFENISLDIMFAIPTQTEAQLVATLEECISLKPKHISAYSLILEDGTPLKRKTDNGSLPLTDDETDRHMYHTLCDMLSSAGYEQYEISNFAKPGYESRHNIVYWERGEYIGLGCAAHSFFAGTRYEAPCETERYIAQAGIREWDKQQISCDDAAEEAVMLGLRMNKGLSESDFLSATGFDIKAQCKHSLDRLTKAGLVVCRDGRISATKAGRDVLNYIILQLVSDFK